MDDTNWPPTGGNADVNLITVVTFHITQTSHAALVKLNRVKPVDWFRAEHTHTHTHTYFLPHCKMAVMILSYLIVFRCTNLDATYLLNACFSDELQVLFVEMETDIFILTMQNFYNLKFHSSSLHFIILILLFIWVKLCHDYHMNCWAPARNVFCEVT